MKTTGMTDLGHGIHCIDTGLYRPGMVACYLVRAGDRAAFAPPLPQQRDLLAVKTAERLVAE